MADPVAPRPAAFLRPWRSTGADMAPAVLLMCKLLFLLLLWGGFRAKIDVPFLPFLAVLDALRDWPWAYARALDAMFLGAGALLLLNVRPRAAAFVLGLVVLLVLLGSKPLFRNHVFIVGCLFLLAGLTRPGRPPVLLYLQLSLVYLGAFLDKVLLLDWTTGQFMDNLLANARENPVYLGLVDVFPRPWVAGVLSWASIVTELVIGLCILFRPTRALAVWIAVLFHFGIYAFLLGERFGHFLEDLLLAFLVVLEWPRGQVALAAKRLSASAARRAIALFDWDRTFVVLDGDAPRTAPIGPIGPIVLDRTGWGQVLRHSAGFYVFLFAGYVVVHELAPEPWTFALMSAAAVGLIVMFLPPRKRWASPARA